MDGKKRHLSLRRILNSRFQKISAETWNRVEAVRFQNGIAAEDCHMSPCLPTCDNYMHPQIRSPMIHNRRINHFLKQNDIQLSVTKNSKTLRFTSFSAILNVERQDFQALLI